MVNIRNFRNMCAATAIAVISATVPSTAEEFTPAMKKLIEGAREEGRVVLVYGAHLLGGPTGAEKLEELINARYGLDLDLEYTVGPSGPSTRAKLMQEVAAGQTTHLDFYPIAVREVSADAFAAIDWREYVPDVPEKAMQYGMRGVSLATTVPGITYNPELVPADMVPDSLDDMLKPEWKGRIAAPPYTYTIQYFALPQLLGYEKAIDFVTKFSKQVSGLIRCGEEERVLSGEFAMFAIDCGEYEVRRRNAMGQPLAHVIPKEGAAMLSWFSGVPKTAPNPNAARLLIAFLLTREGQDFIWEVNGLDSVDLPGSKIAKVVEDYKSKGVKIIDVSLEQSNPIAKKAAKEMLSILQAAQ